MPPLQGCHVEITLGVSCERSPANAYDKRLAASITVRACTSSCALFRREVGPEMHIDPSKRQFRPNTGAATLETWGSRSPKEM